MVFKRADNDGSRTVSSSELHNLGPEKAKLRCLYLVVLEQVLQGRHALQIEGEFDVQMRKHVDVMCTSELDKLAQPDVNISVSVHTSCVLPAPEWAVTAVCPLSQLHCLSLIHI